MVAANTSPVVVEIHVVRSYPRLRRAGLSDLLPWADPYIARLVSKVKAEIQADRLLRKREELAADGGEELDDEDASSFALGDFAFDPYRCDEPAEFDPWNDDE